MHDQDIYLIGTLAGKQKEALALIEFRKGIGNALTQEKQQMVSDKLPTMNAFIDSDAGKKAAQTFVDAWTAWLETTAK